MATKPLGKGTSNLSVNLPQTLRDELESLAAKSGMAGLAMAVGVFDDEAPAPVASED